MQASVKIKDIDVDMITNDSFIQKINECLANDKLNVIFFASTELLNRAVEDETYRELIDQADLFLPGEEALLSAHHVDVMEAGGMVVSCKSFGNLLANLWKEECSMYILTKNEAEIATLEAWCKRMQPKLRINASWTYDPAAEDAALVNEINSYTPDILLVNLELGQQEQWIMEHRDMLDAKLCIAIGGVAGLILAEEKETPGWVHKFHLSGLYEKMIRQQKVKKNVRARIFRKQVVQYNNQNENKKDDA